MSSQESAWTRLKKMLDADDFYFKKALGQNFLISDLVIERILTKARSIPSEQILEIGPGLGSLTEGLMQLGRPLRLLELDRRLCEYWSQKGLFVNEGDALQWDWSQLGSTQTLLVSNLPYQISSSLVIDRCAGPAVLTDMILMFQKEVAQRLTAGVSTAEYGLLSVMAQTHFKMTKVSEASPRDFHPAPKVASRVLHFRREEHPGLNTKNLLRILKLGFGQRRKKLVNNLKKSDLAKNEGVFVQHLNDWLVGRGLSVDVRAENLNPRQWAELSMEMGKSGN